MCAQTRVSFLSLHTVQVYGPCQYPEKLIPKFIVRALRGETLPIHGNGTQRRGYVHVVDVARAFNLLLDHGTMSHGEERVSV